MEGKEPTCMDLLNITNSFLKISIFTKAVKFAALPAAGFSIENSAVGAERW